MVRFLHFFVSKEFLAKTEKQGFLLCGEWVRRVFEETVLVFPPIKTGSKLKNNNGLGLWSI